MLILLILVLLVSIANLVVSSVQFVHRREVRRLHDRVQEAVYPHGRVK